MRKTEPAHATRRSPGRPALAGAAFAILALGAGADSARVDGCTIHAPDNGRVVDRAAHTHAWLQPGQKFQLHIDDTGRTYPALSLD